MKLRTHAIFSAGLVAYVSAHILGLGIVEVTTASLISVLIQVIIDSTSHEVVTRNGITYVRRSPVFHSFEGGLVLTAAMAIVMGLLGMSYIDALAISGTSIFSHLLLDHFTERGIYVLGRRTRRKRGISNSSLLANGVASLIGLLLLLYTYATIKP